MSSPHGDSKHYARLLLETDVLREHVMSRAVEWLALPKASRGLDAGCGVGSQTFLLAKAVGPGGHVTGLDISEELLSIARERSHGAGVGGTVEFRKGDINHIRFEPDTFDWAWSADCAGPGTGDPLCQVERLARIVRPGGAVCVLAWSAQNLLPGYPGLEARLNASPAGIAPFKQGMKPEAHFFRARVWLEKAGLEDVWAKTFVSDIQPPLSEATRHAMMLLFDMRWGDEPGEVNDEDRRLYKHLTDPGSPNFILDQPGYYAFFTYTAFRGKKP
jgi:ubiquinone/menaquinone biosynthesis C-methylase UbiE